MVHKQYGQGSIGHTGQILVLVKDLKDISGSVNLNIRQGNSHAGSNPGQLPTLMFVMVQCSRRFGIMASTLKINTLTGVSTAGSIAVTGEGNSTTTNLQQGLAKVGLTWMEQILFATDSLNVSGLYRQ